AQAGQVHETRYEAERRLLEVQVGEPPEHFAVNLFSVDSVSILPIAQYALWFLTEQRRLNGEPVTRAGLFAFLAASGFSEDDVRGVLERLVHVRRRLIYSGVADAVDGIDAWRKEGNMSVELTLAGRGYIDALVRVPSYLQW